MYRAEMVVKTCKWRGKPGVSKEVLIKIILLIFSFVPLSLDLKLTLFKSIQIEIQAFPMTTH